MKLVTSFVLIAAFAASVIATAKLKLQDLSPAVQKVKEQTKGATLVGLAKETANGKTVYEVETKVNGRTSDLMVDANGGVLSIEEEVPLASIPAAAKATIEKQAQGGKIKRVETLTKGGKVSYEAAITKGGKTSEIR